MDDLIPEFLTETNESLSDLDTSLVELEQNPDNKELLSEIFRVMHTIKGTSGFFDLQRLGAVAHKAEDLLGLFRDDKLQPTPEYISLIFDALDTIKDVIAGLEETGKEPQGDDSAIIAKLTAACEGGEATPAAPQEDATPPEEQTDSSDANIAESTSESEEIEFTPIPAPVTESTDEDVEFTPIPAPITEDAGEEIEFTPIPAPVATPETEKLEATPPKTPPVKKQDAVKSDAAASAAPESNSSLQTLRVNVDVLEYLMTLVSELVLTRNQILQVSRAQKDNDISESLQRLNQIVSDLQEGVMKTRMQPVGNAWAKLPRIIRDISNNLGKKINLKMLGKETELDRQVLEMIKDPLTHMVRNSGDHGIETPEERLAAGKTETGTITLNSYHEGGHILIQISDDGRGLSLDKIKTKIIENEVATADEIAEMSDKQIQQYIFAAGFSTAEKVTAVSGRGVGMDVVRTNIEKINGSIEMDSVEGKGTTFTIKIPLTLAIVSSLILGIKNERFAIPQLDVTELLLASKDGAHQIEMVNNTPILRLRKRILPLICLRCLLDFSDPEENAPRYIVVVSVGSSSFGIVVDSVFDTEEIVVKPLTSLLSNKQTVFSGNTILGDGQVIMILDSSGILKASGISDKLTANQSAEEDAENIADDTKSLLLFYAGDKNVKAVPLKHVARLEEVSVNDVEMAGGQHVIQYGDTLMPIYLYDKTGTFPEKGNHPVIVFKTGEGMSGLLVDRILDITSHTGEYQIHSEDGPLEGSAIVQGKTTDIINLSHDRSNNAANNIHASSQSNGSSFPKSPSNGFPPRPDVAQPTDHGAAE